MNWTSRKMKFWQTLEIFVFIVLFGKVSSSACPLHWAQHLSKCYRVFKMEYVYNNAKSFCSSQSATLPILDTPEQHEFVLSAGIRHAKSSIWIGLQEASYFQWSWYDGTRYQWSNWDVLYGYPKLGQCCNKAAIYFGSNTRGKWQDYPDNAVFYGHPPLIICEKKLASPSTPLPKWFATFDHAIITMKEAVSPLDYVTQCLHICETKSDCIGANFFIPLGSSRYACGIIVHYETGPIGLDMIATAHVSFWMREKQTMACDTELTKLVPDSSWTADSEYSSTEKAHHARLYGVEENSGKGKWRPALTAIGSTPIWLMIDFGKVVKVARINMQGAYQIRISASVVEVGQVVVKYYVMYTVNKRIWRYVRLQKNKKSKILIGAAFAGNADLDLSRATLFNPWLTLSAIRIMPMSWYTYPSLRVGVFGCNLENNVKPPDRFIETTYDVGLRSGDVRESYMKASSVKSTSTADYPPWMARTFKAEPQSESWNPVQPFWGGLPLSAIVGDTLWLQITLLTKYRLTGITIFAVENKGYLRKVKVSYSTDSSTFTFILGSDGLPLEFDVNVQHKMGVFIDLPDTEANNLRIHILLAQTSIAANLEIHGIPLSCSSSSPTITSSSTCTCATSSNQIWCTASTSFDISYIHSIYGVVLSTLGSSATIPDYSLSYSIDGSSWVDIPKEQINDTIISSSKKVVIISATVARYLKITCVNSCTHCTEVAIQTCPLEACPENYFLQGDQCYWIAETYMTPSVDKQRKICERNSWADVGHPVVAKDAIDAYFIASVASIFPVDGWTGLKKTTNWFWPNETSPAVGVNWGQGQPGSGSCASLSRTKLSFESQNCATPAYGICQTKALVLPTDQKCVWITYNNAKTSSPLVTGTQNTYSGVTLTYCLSKCRTAGIGCASVMYTKLSKACYLLAKTSVDAGVQITVLTGTILFELDCSGCQKRLVWGTGTSPLTDVRIKASAISTLKSADNAALGNAQSYWKTTSMAGDQIQIDLGRKVNISKIVLQGGDEQEDCQVTEYSLFFSNSTIYWTSPMDSNGKYLKYITLSNRYGMHITRLSSPVISRFVKIVPVTWKNSICLRFEILGCEVNQGKGCSVDAQSWLTGDSPAEGHLRVNSIELLTNTQTAGITIAKVTVNNSDCTHESPVTYTAIAAQAQKMANDIAAFPDDTLVIGATGGDISAAVPNLITGMKQFGLDLSTLSTGESFVFLLQKGRMDMALWRNGKAGDGPIRLAREIGNPDRGQCGADTGMETGLLGIPQIMWPNKRAWLTPLWSVVPSGVNVWENLEPKFVTVDLWVTYRITAVIIQGGGKQNPSCWTKSFSIQYSADNNNWSNHVKQGTIIVKEYDASTDTDTAMKIDISPAIEGRYIRITPVTLQSMPCFRFELLGCPIEGNAIDVSSMGATITASQSSTTAIQAINNATSGWCSSTTAGTDIWWEITTPTKLYLIRKIEVTVNDLNAVVDSQMKWKDSTLMPITSQQYKTITRDTASSKAIHELNFSPVLLQRTVRILITPKNNQNLCVTIKFYGKNAPNCVPGSVAYGDQCLYITEMKMDLPTQRKICQRSGLHIPGELIMAKTYLSQQFIAALLTAKGYSEAGIGIEFKDNKWKWVDGEEATGLPWAPGNDGVGATHAFLTDQAFFKETAPNAESNGICQSVSLVELTGVSFRWIFRPNSTLSAASTSHNGQSTLTCLSKCLTEGNNCLSVVIKESTGTCQIFAKDRNSATLSTSNGEMYFEKFSADNCSASVFGVTSLATLAASSTINSTRAVQYSKLNTIPQSGVHLGHWQPTTNAAMKEYIEVQLSQNLGVIALVVQGQGSSYVTEFVVVYSDPDINLWRIVPDQTGKMKKFEGNWGANLHYTVVFPTPLRTNKLRVYPTSFVGSISLRWDVYGVCPTNASDAITALGFESKDIADWQFTESSFFSSSTQYAEGSAARLRLTTAGSVYGGWRPKEDPSWIQVDLLILHELAGIATQGDSDNNGFCKELNLTTSSDGASWTVWKAGTANDVIYEVNFDSTLEIFTEFKPHITTQFLRIHPTNTANPALRMELYGKPVDCPNIIQQTPAPADTMDATTWINDCRPTLKDMNTGSGSCYQWCPLSSDSSPSLTVHFHSGYHLTKVIIHTSDVNANYILQHSMDGNSWIAVSKQNKIIGSNTVTFEFVTITTQRHLKISYTPSGTPACLHLVINGCPSKDCPTSYARHGTYCYFLSNVQSKKDEAKTACAEHAKKWGGIAHLAQPSTPEKYYFLRHVMMSEPLTTWTGADQSGTTWQWTDGSTISWTKWEGGLAPTGNGQVGYLDTDGDMKSRQNGNTKWRYLCEVPAAISDLQPTYNSWFYREDQIKPGEKLLSRESFSSVTQCLHACQSGWISGCLSVRWFRGKVNPCIMFGVNRYNGWRPSDSGRIILWEMFSHGSCGIPLLASVQTTIISIPSASTSLLPLAPYGTYAGPGTTLEIKFLTPVMMTSINTRSGEKDATSALSTFKLYTKEAGQETIIPNQEQKEVNLNEYRGANTTGICVGNFFPDPVLIKETLKISLLGNPSLQMEVYGCTLQSPIICYQHPSPILTPSGVPNGVSLECLNEWTLILRRSDASSSFDKTWQDYKTGFSYPKGDMWIGLATLAHITKFLSISLRIDIWDSAGEFYSTEFQNFKVHSEGDVYKIEVSGFIGGTAGHSDLTVLTNSIFSTSNQDSDNSGCGATNKAGWWFNKVGSGPCYKAFLTGTPGTTIAWDWTNATFPTNKPITKVLMRARPYDITAVNVAIEKTSWLSPGQDASWKPSYATDGLEGGSKCAYTTPGTDPWWQVDLMKTFLISSIWFAKPDATFATPTDLKFYVGATKAEGNFATSGYTLCKAMSGPIIASTTITCDSSVEGRFVAIQMPGSLKQLAVCEAKVMTTEVQQALGNPCTWNQHCSTDNAECRPQDMANTTAETFICDCTRFYRKNGTVCAPEADLLVEVAPPTVPTGGIVRTSITSVGLSVKLTHSDGPAVDVSGSAKQFHIDSYMTDIIPDGSTTNIFKATSSFTETELPGVTSLSQSSATVNFSMNATISADHCSKVKYLCINVTTTSAAMYFEMNYTNNLVCQDISSHMVCKPALNLSVTVDAYQDTKPIVRAKKDNFTFSATITNPVGSHHVVALQQNSNFQFDYFYHTTGQSITLSSQNTTSAIISHSDAASAVSSGATKTVTVIVTSSMKYEECDSIKYLCLLLKADPNASYTESDTNNNFNCLDISLKKSCKPPTKIKVENFTTIPSNRQIIRGYNETVSFSVGFKNIDPLYDVFAPLSGGINFNFSAYFSNSLKTVSEIYDVKIDGETANASLSRGEAKTVTSSIEVLISRTDCNDITHFCAKVLPAEGSSYMVATGTDNIQCIAITSQLPCAGIKVENFSIASEPYAVEKTSSPIDFKWTKGTDIVINIDFGDGSSDVWKWDTNNHITSYMDHVATTNHAYNAMGTFTITVTAQNAAGSETRIYTIKVVPNLNFYLTMSFDSKPNIPPVDATFNIALKSGVTIPALEANCSVIFDDRDNTIKNSTKAVTNADFPLTISHKYITDWPDSWAEVKCTNQKSIKKLHPAVIILQQNVTGLKIKPDPFYGPSNMTTSILAYLETGNDVFCLADFGYNNVSTFTFKHPNKMAKTAPISLNYVYPEPGQYDIQVACNNKHFRDVANATVIIMDPVINFTIFGSNNVSYPPGNLSLGVTQDPNPQNATCNFTIDGEIVLSKEAKEFSSASGTETFQIMIPPKFAGTNKTMNVTCYNKASNYSLLHEFDYLAKVVNLTFTNQLVSLVNQNLTLILSLDSGSYVAFEIDFGDGTNQNVNHPHENAAAQKFTLQKVYTSIGSFLIQVKAKNAISEVTNSSYIYVHNAITNLTFRATNSTIWPPGFVVYHITSGTGQALLHNVTCLFNYANKSMEQVLYSEIKVAATYNITRNFSREYLGTLNTNINCTNEVSFGIGDTTTEYILDAVILDSLQSNGSVLWKNTSMFELKIKRFGTGACFLWSMGNGNTTLYGVASCQAKASQDGHPFILIPAGTMAIAHNHTYSNFGTFNVTVKGFNDVSDHILWTNAIVLDWPCQRPNITFSLDITDPLKPLEKMRSEKFNISASYEIDCMKTKQVYSAWQFVLSGKLVHETLNETEFIHAPRTLPYGTIQVLHTASMHGANDTNRTLIGYIKINKTPLAINMTEPKTVMFDTMVEINAINFTHDYDVQPGDKTGMSFTWACVRTNETVYKSVVGTNAPIQNGCLGDGNKVLSQFAGKGSFMLNTSYLQPMSTHELTILVTKDTRSVSHVQEFYVTPIDPPVIKIICRLRNCAPNGRVKGSVPIVLKAVCLKNCVSKYGPLSMVWKLYKMEKGSKTAVMDLRKLTMSELTEPSLFIRANTLDKGTKYIAEVESFTPGTPVVTFNYTILVNRPPYNGSCEVSPQSGNAAKTLYTITCVSWLEWRPNIPGGYLRYNVRIVLPGGVKTFPLAIQDKDSITTVLPMGEVKDKTFTLVLSIYIVDTLDDFTEFRTSTKVTPQNLTERELVNKQLATAKGTDGVLPDLASKGKHSEMMTKILATLSEINVQHDLYAVPKFKSEEEKKQYYDNITRDEAEIRQLLSAYILKNPADSLVSITQTCVTLDSLLTLLQESSIGQLKNAASGLTKAAATFYDLKKQGKILYPPAVANDLLSTVMNIMITGDFQNKKIDKELKTNLTSLSDNLTVASQETVTDAMRTSVEILNGILTTLSDDKEANDPDDNFFLSDLSVIVSRKSSDRAGNRNWNTKQGILSIPQTTDIFSKPVPNCIDTKVAMISVNPFIYGNQTGIKVNSSIVDFKMESCSTSRKKRDLNQVNNSEASANFSVGVRSYGNSQLTYINKSTIDPKGLLFHPLNITLPDTSVRITFLPEVNQTYNIYLAMGRRPYPDTDSVIRNISLNSTDVVDTASIVTDQKFTFYVPPKNLSIGTLYVGIKREDCYPKDSCPEQLQYYYQIMDINCKTWRDDEELWRPASCKVDTVTETGDVIFKSNLFGSLAAGLFVGPNKIDFGSVFQDLDKKIVENILVVMTVLGIILLYIPCVIVCRRMDKRDSAKWQSIMLLDNQEDAQFEYEVHIFTGKKRNAGTKSKVIIDIKGTLGSTGPRALTDGNELHFKGGEINIFSLKTNEELGDLVYVNIWHDNSGKGDHGSWFLDKVVVVDKSELMWSVFWCNDWLAIEEGDGKLERLLIVENFDLNVNNGALMRNNVQRTLFDTHLWFSVVVRQVPSRFTRVQRLSVCLALLYLTMISNAMWYKTGEGGKSGTITIGPISLGVHEIYVSVLSSIIVVPPILLISVLFAKSGPKPEKRKNNSEQPEEHKDEMDQNDDDDEDLNSDANEDELKEISESVEDLNSNNNNGNNEEDYDTGNEQQQKFRRTKPSQPLPWWTLYIGWVLVFLSVALSAFFVILYSFQWGRVISTAWLSAFFLSFFESMILVQPLKVLIVASLLSFIFKKDADVRNFESIYGKVVKTGGDYLDCDIEQGPHTAISELEMETIRERRLLDKKTNSMVKEVFKHSLVMLLFTMMCYINIDPRVFMQTQHLRQMFQVGEEGKFSTTEDIWKWLEDHALEGIFFDKGYNGHSVTTYDKKFMVDGYFRRLSPPRIRQLRANPEPCRIYLTMNKRTKRCTASYNAKTEDNRSYKDSPWRTPLNESQASEAATKVAKGKMKDLYQYTVYVPGSEIDGFSHWGLRSTYNGGGYIANLGANLQTGTDVVQKLKTLKWLDERTRAVFLEFSIYNANTNLFSLVTVLLEVTPWGGIYQTVTVQSLLLYRYNGAVGFIAIIIEIICIIWMIYKIVVITASIIKLKKKYFLDIWNWVDFSVIVALFIGFTFYIMRSYWTVKKVEQMMNNKEQSVNFSFIVFYDNLYMTGIGYATYATILRFLHILRYNKTIADLSATLAKGAWDMITLGVWGISMLIAFSVLIYTTMGSKIKEYATPGNCILHMVTTFLGHFDFQTVEEEGGNWGRVILLIYLLIMMFLILNIFITVINETLADIGEEDLPDDYKVMEHFFDVAEAMIFGMFKINKLEEQEKTDENQIQELKMEDIDVSPTTSRRQCSLMYPSKKPRTEDFNFYFMKKFSRLKGIPFTKDNEDAEMIMLYILMNFDRRTSNPAEFCTALSFMR